MLVAQSWRAPLRCCEGVRRCRHDFQFSHGRLGGVGIVELAAAATADLAAEGIAAGWWGEVAGGWWREGCGVGLEANGDVPTKDPVRIRMVGVAVGWLGRGWGCKLKLKRDIL